MKINQIVAPTGVQYLDAPQHSPEWVAIRVGRKTSSQMAAWIGKGVKGQFLKPHYDYERELVFEKQFKVPFSRFVSEAMDEGVAQEKFIKEQYTASTGREVVSAGAFYDDDSASSPDGFVGDDGLVECKWLWDTKFSEVLDNGILPEHQIQVQDQLRMSGRKWVDYVVANGNSKKIKIIRVERDEAIIAEIAKAAKEPIEGSFKTDGVFDFTKEPDTINW